jgi:pectate lyase-like protein
MNLLRSLGAALTCTLAGMPVASVAIEDEELVGPFPSWTNARNVRFCITCTKQPKQMCAHLCATIFAASTLVAIIPPLSAQAQSIPATGDEFVGPFASWANVKTNYGAKGDGVTDDTATLQAALSAVGKNGANPVLWIPPGTYVISGTLTVSNVEDISILGQDPSTTIIKWSGPSGGTMLHVSGIDYSRISRLTFEGSGTAGVIVDQSNTMNGYFDTGNEYADDFFQNAGTGIQCGGDGANGCSEMSVLRDHFTNLTQIGVVVENYNALDIWVRYSVFDHDAVGVGDCSWSTGLNGAGDFRVYNSIFRYSSVQDICIGNTSSFSFRNNYSIGSNYFIGAGNTNNPAPTVVQGNTIIDPINTIYWGNLGPVIFDDNTILSISGTAAPIISSNAWAPSDMIAVGNTVTVTNPFANSSGGPLTEIGTTVVSPASINTAEPTLPGVEPNYNREVVEVPVGASAAQIQSAVNKAVSMYNGQRPIVHIPAGNYGITQTLTIPANSDVQLVGDGGRASSPTRTFFGWAGSGSGPVLLIQGPSTATLRDIFVQANQQVDAIDMTDIDQAGSRVYMFGIYAGGGTNSGIFYDGLNYTAADIIDGGAGGELSGVDYRVIGGPQATVGNSQGGKLAIYDGGGGGDLSYASYIDVSNGGTLLYRDMWFDGAPSNAPHWANITSGTVTFEGSHIWGDSQGEYPSAPPTFDLASLQGRVTVLDSDFASVFLASGNGSQAQIAGIGVVRDQPAPTASYFLNNASPPAIMGLLDSQQWTTSAQGTSCGCATIETANSGTTGNTFVTTTMAQARAEQTPMLAALPAGVSDVRLFRVSANLGINDIHLEATGGDVVPSSEVTTTASGLAYSRVSQTFNGTVTIKNISSGAISGPFEILLTGLTAGVSLVNATGQVSGAPFVVIAAVSLLPGQSVTVGIRFKDPSFAVVKFVPVIYSGGI